MLGGAVGAGHGRGALAHAAPQGCRPSSAPTPLPPNPANPPPPLQTQGTSFPILTAERTGQPSATFVISYLDGVLADVDRALAGCARGAGEGRGGWAGIAEGRAPGGRPCAWGGGASSRWLVLKHPPRRRPRTAEPDAPPAAAAAAQRARAAVCGRLEAATGILATAVNTVFANPPLLDALVRGGDRAARRYGPGGHNAPTHPPTHPPVHPPIHAPGRCAPSPAPTRCCSPRPSSTPRRAPSAAPPRPARRAAGRAAAGALRRRRLPPR
jgi:hypothetical protein